MHIRRYNAESDQKFYLEGESESFKVSYPEVEIDSEREEYIQLTVKHKYSQKDIHGLTLEAEAIPVGMIVLHERIIFSEKICYITNVYVKNSYRGNGALELLFEAAESKSREIGAGKIILDVTAQNNAALAAYEKLGFVTSRLTMEKML